MAEVGKEQPFTVLIVDDDHSLCRALSDVIAAAGYRVECLSGGDEPYRAIRAAAPDVVLLDVSMPEARGLETLRRLEVHRDSRKLPVIVTSRQAELEYELLDVFDFLVKPVDEQRLLEDLAQLAAAASGTAQTVPPLGDADLALFHEFLVLHSGLHFDRRNAKILERGLVRRMRAVRVSSYRSYFAYLQRHQENRQELKKLLGLLTIGETYFFRYLPHYEALIRDVVPEFIERNRREKRLRIWSAGCSSGEEPYSLAMVLREHFPELADWDVRILATDINKRALRQAAEGIFRPRALRVTEPRYRERYFRPLGSSFVLDPQIRSMVDFAYLNLQTGTYPSTANGTTATDILLCRNVMIYFRLPTIRRMVAKFARSLRPGGYLFLGHAETLMNVSERFQRVHNAGGFYYRLRDRESAPRPRSEPPPPPPPARAKAPVAPPAPRPRPPQPLPEPPPLEPQEAYLLGMTAFEREEFGVAAEHFEVLLAEDSGHVGALVGLGFICANGGRHAEAVALCDRALAVDDLCAEAYFLRGLILELELDLAGAIDEYRKALLLDMDFIMPHYNLSKVFWRLGRQRDARRELNNTRRLLERAADEASIPHSGGLSRAVFLEICREDAARIGEL